eukprot:TRINITY_DN9828_c0_g1_i2.p1 TRINITY_DN9828_c0_g1~~TRINITY_DN9828_c0_g1_i2.p1  ORF type:complete len:401 (+),score=81.05 TRINITY_DN9828_c0_g1_i2:78-1205(+)
MGHGRGPGRHQDAEPSADPPADPPAGSPAGSPAGHAPGQGAPACCREPAALGPAPAREVDGTHRGPPALGPGCGAAHCDPAARCTSPDAADRAPAAESAGSPAPAARERPAPQHAPYGDPSGDEEQTTQHFPAAAASVPPVPPQRPPPRPAARPPSHHDKAKTDRQYWQSLYSTAPAPPQRRRCCPRCNESACKVVLALAALCAALLACPVAGTVLFVLGESTELRSPAAGKCYEAHLSVNGSCHSSGLSPINNSLDCLAAAVFMGDPFVNSAEACSARPTGCYYVPSERLVYYSDPDDCQGAAMPPNDGRQVICQGQEHPLQRCQWAARRWDALRIAGVVLLCVAALPCFCFCCLLFYIVREGGRYGPGGVRRR